MFQLDCGHDEDTDDDYDVDPDLLTVSNVCDSPRC